MWAYLDGFLYAPDEEGPQEQPQALIQRSQQLVTLLSLTVAHPLGNRGFLPTGKTNFPGPRVEVV